MHQSPVSGNTDLVSGLFLTFTGMEMENDILTKALTGLWYEISDSTAEEVTFATLKSAFLFRLRWARRLGITTEDFVSMATIEILQLKQSHSSPIDTKQLRRAIDRASEEIRKNIRSLCRHVSLNFDIAKIEEQRPKEIWLSQERVKKLRDALLQKLNTEELNLFDALCEGVQIQFMASDLQTSQNYIRTRKHRLLKKVRQIMEDLGFFEQDADESVS